MRPSTAPTLRPEGYRRRQRTPTSQTNIEWRHAVPHRPCRPSPPVSPLIAHVAAHRPCRPSSPMSPLIAHVAPHRPCRPSPPVSPLIARVAAHRPCRRSSPMSPLIAHVAPHRLCHPERPWRLNDRTRIRTRRISHRTRWKVTRPRANATTSRWPLATSHRCDRLRETHPHIATREPQRCRRSVDCPGRPSPR